MVTLGDKVKDKYTKVEGVVTAITDYLFGCRRICVELPTLDKDGSIREYWFDEQRVTVKGQKPKATTGGPGGPIPSQRTNPS